MIRTVLLDLDGTLLDVDMNALLAEYYVLLARHFSALGPTDTMLERLRAGIKAMYTNTTADDNLTVFMAEFCRLAGCPEPETRVLFERFYVEKFGDLRHHARPLPQARALVQWLFESGYEVVIATQPVFPLTAIRHRLSWAKVDDFPYRLVTVCENMHGCKPSPHYFNEILTRMGRAAEECLMVGNDCRTDLGARAAGIRTYMIAAPGERVAEADYSGGLEGVRAVLEADRGERAE